MQIFVKTLVAVFVATILLASSQKVEAATSPIGISIFPPVQFPPADYDVYGLRLNLLVGKHREVSGIDLGVIGNITTQKFNGLAIAGGFNRTYQPTNIYGLQLAGIANINSEKTRVIGFQVALVNANNTASTIAGIQLGVLANLSSFSDVYGAQLGIYNSANNVYGFQIGLVNVATNLHGLQIGLANFHLKGLFYVCPIINFGF